MLELAAKYETQLQALFADAFLDPQNMYFFSDGYTDKYKACESTWGRHEFVSVESGCQVIGYMAYSIDRRANAAHSLAIIRFRNRFNGEYIEKSLTFQKDLRQFLTDIFDKYKFRKLSFCVFVGNPHERMYDRYIKKFGGRIVGTAKKDTMLMDGSFYDSKQYEIFREDYLSRLKPARVQKP
jgi:hypothetical protein